MSSTKSVGPTIRVSTRQYRFSVVREEAPQYPIGRDVITPASAAEIARAVIGTEITEVLITIFVNARHRVMGYAEIARLGKSASHTIIGRPRSRCVGAVPCQRAKFGSSR